MTIQETFERATNELRTWIINNLKLKVDKEEGKVLSANDFSNEDKNKLGNVKINSVEYTRYLDNGNKIGTLNIDDENIDIFTPIYEITDSLTTDDSNIDLSAKAGKSLQDQVNTIKNTLSTQGSTIDNLNKSISTINTEQTTQNNNLSNLSNNLTSINNEQSVQVGRITALSNTINVVGPKVDKLNSLLIKALEYAGTVTYNVDGTEYSEYLYGGASCLSPKTFTPSKSGYTFSGWSLDRVNVLSEKIMTGGNITLYAMWK